MYGIQTTVQPTAEPVTLNEAKHQCFIETSETFHDSNLTDLIVMARETLENATGLSLMTQTKVLTLPDFPSGRAPIYLPGGPVQSVTSVSYATSSGSATFASHTLANGRMPDALHVNSGTSWPTAAESPNGVTITYQAGYQNAAAVPAIAKQAIKLLVGYWFKNREAASDRTFKTIPNGFDNLASQLRVGEEFIDYCGGDSC